MYNLNGKVALVTGAGGEHGIGRAICQRLAREGCDLVVNDLHTQPYSDSGWGGLPALVAEIEAVGQQPLQWKPTYPTPTKSRAWYKTRSPTLAASTC